MSAYLQDDAVTLATSTLNDVIPQLLTSLEDARRYAPDAERRQVADILSDRAGTSLRSILLLVEKLEGRPGQIEYARRQIEDATEPAQIKAAIRLLGAMRVQDREFDQGVTELYEWAHRLLQEFEPVEIAENLEDLPDEHAE